MTPVTAIFLLFAVSYFSGSIPFGLLIAKIVRGIDIREHGSRNIGATNVMRVVSKKWGIFVLFLDALKGFLPVFMLPAALPENSPVSPFTLQWVLGIAAILGHSFPVWLKFRGGKGVATSLGVFLAIAPAPTAVTFLLWAALFFLFRIISLASLAAALFFPAVVWVTYRHLPNHHPLTIIALLLSVFIFFTHRHNIRRLLKGEEKK